MSSQLLNAAARLEGLEASMPVKGPWRLQSNAVYYQYPSGTMGVLVNRAESGVPFNTVARIERGGDCLLRSAVALLRWLDR